MNTANRVLIEQAISDIERHLKHPVSLDGMSGRLGLSKFHLHRLFTGVTGMPLMQYARARKLTASLDELLGTDLKIIDIALEYGFEYEQSYERAFKRQFGISPAAYRRRRGELAVVKPVDTSLMRDVAQGLLIEPRFMLKPSFTVAGVPAFVVHEQNIKTLCANTQGKVFFDGERSGIVGEVNPQVYYGLCLHGENPEYGNDYMPSVEVQKPFDAPPPLCCKTLPTAHYAVFRYVGLHAPQELTIRCLNEIYDFIYHIWQQNSVYSQSLRYHFERMDLARCAATYCEADIYVPLDGYGESNTPSARFETDTD